MPSSRPLPFHDLFLLHRPELLRLLTRRVGASDAADLLQETYFRVLRRAESEAIAEPHAFLQATAINLAKDHQRRRRTEQKWLDFGDLPQDAPDAAPLADDRIEGRQKLALLQEAVARLPPRCREVFVMRRLEDLPQMEIARRLGISRNMVQQHLRLALERCHEALD